MGEGEILCEIAEPLLARLRAHCLAKPQAFEDHPWDQVAFKVGPKGRMFCACMGMSPAVMLKSTPDRQAELCRHPAVSYAPYLGHHGWVSVQIRDEEELALALELVDESYALVVHPPKRKNRSGAR